MKDKILEKIHESFNEMVTDAGLSEDCTVNPEDSVESIRRKCKTAFKHGIYHYPMYRTYSVRGGVTDIGGVSETYDYATFWGTIGKGGDIPINKVPILLRFADIDSGLQRAYGDYNVDEADSSTERVRRYYKRHPERVRKYLRDTVKDRVARNRDRRKAVNKYGKSKMKNHDVHHPDGPRGGNWRLAKKDHGRDKKKVNETYLIETPPKPENMVVFFVGNFQPFNLGHFKVYDGLVNKFGRNNTYIVPTGQPDAIKRPLGFSDNRDIMTRMFDIPSNMIVQTKNPYRPTEILKKLPQNTAYAVATTERNVNKMSESDRGFFKMMDEASEEYMRCHMEEGYLMIVPEMKLVINNQNINSTQFRSIMGGYQYTERVKQEIFTKIYGKFDKKIFDKLVRISMDSEEARQLTNVHGEGSATTLALPPKRAIENAKAALALTIRDPSSGKTMNIATALRQDKSSSVYQTAVSTLQSALKDEDLNEDKEPESEQMDSVDLGRYLYVRTYTPEELQQLVQIYFENEDLRSLVPTLPSTEEEMKYEIMNAPSVILTTDQMIAFEGSKVSDIFQSEDKEKFITKLSDEDQSSVADILLAVKKKEQLPQPLVIRTGMNQYYLVYGDMTLVALASVGLTIPVKSLVHKTEKPISEPVPNKEPPEQNNQKMSKSDKELLNRIMQMKITNPETGNPIKIDTAMDYNRNHPAHLLAMQMIRHYMKEKSTRAGVAKTRHYI